MNEAGYSMSLYDYKCDQYQRYNNNNISNHVVTGKPVFEETFLINWLYEDYSIEL